MIKQKLLSVALLPLLLFPSLSGGADLPWLSNDDSSQPLIASDSLFTHGDRTQKQIALTFDADMTPAMKWMVTTDQISGWYDKKITQELEETQTPATIFITGMWAQMYPKAVKEFSQSPLFEIGNHSYSHPSFASKCYGLAIAGPDSLPEEITKTQSILTKLTGKTPTLFRFPGGCATDEDYTIVEDHDLRAVGWDVVSGDAFNPDAESIIKNVLGNTQDGSVIIMHIIGGPNAPETSTVLPTIIAELKKRGYEFVTISDLLSRLQPQPEARLLSPLSIPISDD